MPETIIEGQDEDDENHMNLAEQYKEWREKYNIADEEDDEESVGDGKRSGTHLDWVEGEMADIKAERWHRQKLDDEVKERKEEEILKYKETRKQEKRLRITKRREEAIEEEEKGRSGGYKYFNEASVKQDDSTGGGMKSSQSTVSIIPRTQRVHEKKGLEMLYWEEEIAAYRTTKKGFAYGMYKTAFEIELKAVMHEIETARK